LRVLQRSCATARASKGKTSRFFLFKNLVELVLQKHPLNLEGLIKILELRAPLNKILSAELEEAFPNLIKVAIPFVPVPLKRDKYRFAGFIAGVGSFGGLNIKKVKIRFVLLLLQA
jgi:hypothetical protein